MREPPVLASIIDGSPGSELSAMLLPCRTLEKGFLYIYIFGDVASAAHLATLDFLEDHTAMFLRPHVELGPSGSKAKGEAICLKALIGVFVVTERRGWEACRCLLLHRCSRSSFNSFPEEKELLGTSYAAAERLEMTVGSLNLS